MKDRNDFSKGTILVTSSKQTRYPKALQKSVNTVVGELSEELVKKGVTFSNNTKTCTITLQTGKELNDPVLFIYACDCVSLLCRGVPFKNAKKVLKDKYFSSIVYFKDFARSSDAARRRKKLLIGNDKEKINLKTVERATGAKVFVYGNTAAIVGKLQQVKEAEAIVQQTARNIHPYYGVTTNIRKKELASSEKTKHKNWNSLLPEYKNIDRRKKKNTKNK